LREVVNARFAEKREWMVVEKADQRPFCLVFSVLYRNLIPRKFFIEKRKYLKGHLRFSYAWRELFVAIFTPRIPPIMAIKI
jgi:hypothetical protein